MAPMELTLSRFFAAENQRRWSPGAVNCCFLLADWAVWLGHEDPAAHLRSRFASEAEFEAFIVDRKGLLNIVQECVDKINGRRGRAVAGAIGVIGSIHNIHRQWGAIHDGSGWNVRFVGGIGPMTARPLAVWEI